MSAILANVRKISVSEPCAKKFEGRRLTPPIAEWKVGDYVNVRRCNRKIIEYLSKLKTTEETKRTGDVEKIDRIKESKGVNQINETGETREIEKIKEIGEIKETKEIGEINEIKEIREIKKIGEIKVIKENDGIKVIKENGEIKETREIKEISEIKEIKETREIKETKEIEEETLHFSVKRILKFNTFEEALRTLPMELILPGIKTVEEGIELYKKFVTIDTQKRDGVVMIELDKV